MGTLSRKRMGAAGPRERARRKGEGQQQGPLSKRLANLLSGNNPRFSRVLTLGKKMKDKLGVGGGSLSEPWPEAGGLGGWTHWWVGE